MHRLTLVVSLVLGAPALAAAQAQPIGAVAALVGQGTITHSGNAERAPAKVRDDVFVRDRIETAEKSVIRVLMGGRITVTVRERSVVTIIDDPMRPRVDLESGKLAFKVHEGGLRAGEVAEVATPNAIVGIRGSLIVAQASGTDSDVTVLEAHKPITIAPRDAPTQTTHLPIGHTVRVSGPRHAARLGPIRRATREHLLHAADMAEVPGRARDGGQERAFQHQARAEVRRPGMEGRAAALQSRAGGTTDRHREAAEARGRRRPDERREVPAEPAEHAFAGRRLGAAR